MITETARPQRQERGWPRRWARGIGRLSGLAASLALLALLGLIVAVAALPLFGYRTRVIYGGSMEPAIGRGAFVISHLVDADTLAVGDIITFQRPEASARVTHRIVAVREENGQRLFTVKGDANGAPDPQEITFDGQAEKVTLAVPYIGYLMSFGRSPQGMVLLVVLPAIGLAMLQVLNMGKRRQGKEKARL